MKEKYHTKGAYNTVLIVKADNSGESFKNPDKRSVEEFAYFLRSVMPIETIIQAFEFGSHWSFTPRERDRLIKAINA